MRSLVTASQFPCKRLKLCKSRFCLFFSITFFRCCASNATFHATPSSADEGGRAGERQAHRREGESHRGEGKADHLADHLEGESHRTEGESHRGEGKADHLANHLEGESHHGEGKADHLANHLAGKSWAGVLRKGVEVRGRHGKQSRYGLRAVGHLSKPADFYREVRSLSGRGCAGGRPPVSGGCGYPRFHANLSLSGQIWWRSWKLSLITRPKDCTFLVLSWRTGCTVAASHSFSLLW